MKSKKDNGSKVKIIKRYQNRKLYDTQQSCYVTLEDIAKMIRVKEEIMVLDNEHKTDITASTLTQIIFEAEKKSAQYAPLFTLREIIQNGNGTMSSYLAKLGAFPKEYIVRAAKPPKGLKPSVESVVDKAAENYDAVKQSLENRVAQAATSGSSQEFTGRLPQSEEAPSLPNSNKNFLSPDR